MEVIDRPEITRVAYMEHYDQNESTGNASKKYIIEFTGKVNCNWLWETLYKALEENQRIFKSLEGKL